MSELKWHVLQAVDRARLRDARVQAHFAVQWLARAARACLPEVSDHSHTNLGWDDAFGALTTHVFSDHAQLGLVLASLKLVILNGNSRQLESQLSLNGRTDADVREWLGHWLRAKGLDPNILDAPSPYSMPKHAIAEGGAYTAEELSGFLSVLSMWFSNANAMLASVRKQIAAQNLTTPPIRCWPHHFDLDTLVPVKPEHTMGVGFEPGDGYYDEPYFYVSMYPRANPATLPALPSIGFWHTKDFLAAIAPAHRLVESGNQRADVEAFLLAATQAVMRALS